MELQRLKVMFAVLALVFVPTAGLVATQAPAHAASCVGGGCTGKDPEVQGCSGDGRTVASFVADLSQATLGDTAYVELRHSNTCKAKWLRVTMSPSKWGCGGGSPGQVRLRNLRADGTQVSMVRKQFLIQCSKAVWTTMVGRTSGSYKVGFCFRFGSPTGVVWGGTWGDPYSSPCKQNKW